MQLSRHKKITYSLLASTFIYILTSCKSENGARHLPPTQSTGNAVPADNSYRHDLKPLPQSTYTITGTLSGLINGDQIELTNGVSGFSEKLSLEENGSFSFTKPILEGHSYSISISKQPRLQNCIAQKNSGTIYANVNDVKIECKLRPPRGLSRPVSSWKNSTVGISAVDITNITQGTPDHASDADDFHDEGPGMLETGMPVTHFIKDKAGNAYFIFYKRKIIKANKDGEQLTLAKLPKMAGKFSSIVADEKYIYASNTEKSLIYRIPIDGSGDFNEPAVWLKSKTRSDTIVTGDERLRDGPPKQATICGPSSLSINPSTGDIYFVDAEPEPTVHLVAADPIASHRCLTKIRRVDRETGDVWTIPISETLVGRPAIIAANALQLLMVHQLGAPNWEARLSVIELQGLSKSSKLREVSFEGAQQPNPENFLHAKIAFEPISKTLFFADRHSLYHLSTTLLDIDATEFTEPTDDHLTFVSRRINEVALPTGARIVTPGITVDPNGDVYLSIKTTIMASPWKILKLSPAVAPIFDGF